MNVFFSASDADLYFYLVVFPPGGCSLRIFYLLSPCSLNEKSIQLNADCKISFGLLLQL